MNIERSIIQEGFSDESCWVQSRTGFMGDLAVMTTQKAKLVGSDVYGIIHSRYSLDKGKTWSDLVPQTSFDIGENARVCDMTPSCHKKSGTILGTGHSVRYDGKDAKGPAFLYRPSLYYSVYDRKNHVWGKVKQLVDKNGCIIDRFGGGCTQRVDLPSGDILLPTYNVAFVGNRKLNHVTVLLLGYDGETLRLKEIGCEIHMENEARGLCEPSLTYYSGRYYLTLRADAKAYVCTSLDGLHYSEPIPWQWDNGFEVPTCNTQQHWVTGPNALYLVYTRKNGKNDHVPRNRAPLYMAKVDEDNLCLLRHEEMEIVPERGAKLGNFGVEKVSERESYVTTTEWMQPIGCEKYGSNNRVWLCKLTW